MIVRNLIIAAGMLILSAASFPQVSFSQLANNDLWYVIIEPDFCKDLDCFQFTVVSCGDRASAQEEAALERANGRQTAHALPEKAVVAQINAGLIGAVKLCVPEIVK
jgi:hypothetical protein